MKKNKIILLSMHALAIAILVIVTTLLSIPLPNGAGYLNFSDAIIFFISISLGPTSGLIVGCLGGLISDITLGYISYAPFTMVIKGIEGFLCGLLYNKMPQKWRFLSFYLCGIMMAILYMIPDLIYFNFSISIYNLPLNIIQGLSSAIIIHIISIRYVKK